MKPVRVALLVAAVMSCACLWADTSTLTFSGRCNGSSTANDGVVWTITSDAAESDFSSSNGIHFGTSSIDVSYITIQTNNISGTITQVKVNASGSSGAVVSVKVGATKFLYGTLPQASIMATALDFNFTGSASGMITVGISQAKAKKALYCKSVEVTYTPEGGGEPMTVTIEGETPVNVSTLTTGANVVVQDGGVLNINDAKSLGDLTVANGGRVELGTEKLTIDGAFIIETTMGSGVSGQLIGATNTNIEVEEAYIDITLGDNANPEKWHAFTVPFPVDALSGIYDTDGNQLVNEVNYAIMDYHGDVRAEGKYGWKKYRGVLEPGTFYIVTVDGNQTTYRMKKTPDGALVAEDTKTLHEYASSIGTNNNGWNGVGNPTLRHGTVAHKVQVLNPTSYTYEAFDVAETNFVVGTPFFIQASGDGTMAFASVSGTALYAPCNNLESGIDGIRVNFGDETYMDRLYFYADADAKETYEVGKDLVKMTMTDVPAVAQIFGVENDMRLCMVNVPLKNNQADCALLLYVPADGEYTISVSEEVGLDVYLTYEDVVIWNLTSGAYRCTLQAGEHEGYGLVARRKVTTDIECLEVRNSDSSVQKIILNDQVYILRGKRMFDVTGRLMK
ncbi:MAG: hypothetical protein J5823_07495 [Paludibacteraceae bacterium]|nr:hypothetical protein [Paludibacteraceae bacterium]